MDSSGGGGALSKAINGCGGSSVLLLVVYDYPQAAEKVIEAKPRLRNFYRRYLLKIEAHRVEALWRFAPFLVWRYSTGSGGRYRALTLVAKAWLSGAQQRRDSATD